MATRVRKAAPVVGLLEACADRRLLGMKLSEKQEELLTLVEATGTVFAAAGRQGGKSLCAGALLTHNLLLRPDLDEMAGGSPRHGLCIANSREQAQIVLSYCRNLVERSPLLRSQLQVSREDRLIFEGGRVLLAMPCQDRLMRGLVASVVVLDEFGHFLSESDGPRVADRVWNAVRPSLATFSEEGRLLAISTPFGDNLFARLHAKARNGELPGAAAFTATTAEMNPRVSAEFLEQERLLLGPQDFEREYEAVFAAAAGNFFEDDAVRAVVGRHRELSPEQGTHWVVGFDPSFSVDPSAAAVVGRSKADREQLVVARVERWVPTRAGKLRRARQSLAGKEEITDRVLDGVAALSAAYNAPVITDQHLPSVVIEGLKQRGVFKVEVRAWTPQTQTDAFRALRARVYSGRITLPADDQLASELCRLRSKLRSGQSQVEIPRTGGDHCDSAIAVASAVLELDSRGVPRPLRTSSALARLGGRPRGFRPRPEADLRAAQRRLEERIGGASDSVADALGAVTYTSDEIRTREAEVLGRRRRSRGYWSQPR